MVTIFNVSTDNLVVFTDTLIENNLQGIIIGTEDDEGVQIEVEHTHRDFEAIDALAEILESDE